jgi:uncharacterized membrane protein
MTEKTFTSADMATILSSANKWQRGLLRALWTNVAIDVAVLGGLIYWRGSVSVLILVGCALVVTSLGYVLIAIGRATNGSLNALGIIVERIEMRVKESNIK